MSKRTKTLICLFVVFVLMMAMSATMVGCDEPECKHKNFEVVSDTATCIENGIKTLKCKDCNKQWTEDSAALGHDYKLIDENTPSCLEDGYNTYKCSRCNDEYVDKSGSACGHQLQDVVTPATCTKEGKIVHKCKNCDFSEEEPIPMLEHEFEVEVTNPTCINEGFTTRRCKNCELKETIDRVPATGQHDYHPTCTQDGVCTGCGAIAPALEHNYLIVSDTATCTENGIIRYECEHCNDYIEEVSLAKGHSVDSWSYSEEKSAEGPECAWDKIQSGFCNSCQQEVVNKTTFYKHNYVMEITNPALCNAKGLKTYTCACGDSYNEEYENVNNHNWVEGETTPDGYTNYTCSYCTLTKKTKSAKEEVSINISKDDITNADEFELKNASISMDEKTAAGLNFDNMTLSADTLTEEEVNGLKLTEEEKQKIGANSVYNFTLSDGENYITTFDGKVLVKVPYTLQEGENPDEIVIWYIDENGEVSAITDVQYIDGYALFETTHFSYYTVVRLTPAERCEIYGHNYKETNVDATCYHEGYIYRICIRCGHSETEVTQPALTHDYSLTVKDSTCTEIGWNTYTCKHCNDTYKEMIPVKAHNYTSEVIQEATCTQAGIIKYTCTDCGKSYETITQKAQHTLSQQIIKPTCTKEGYTLNTCDVCGFSYKTNISKAWGHDIVDEVVEPTCTAQGYTVHTCTRCDYKITDNYQSAKGHTWDIAAPNCGRGQICLVCSQNGLPATGKHTMNSDGVCEVCGQGCVHEFKTVVVAPGCESVGYTQKTCEICKKVVKSDYLPAIGHSWKVDDKKEATCTQSGYIHSVCDNCQQEKNDYLLPKGHNYSNGQCVNCGKIENTDGTLYTNMFNSIFADTYTFYTSNFVLPESIVGYEAKSLIASNAKIQIKLNDDGSIRVMGEIYADVDLEDEILNAIIRFSADENYTYYLLYTGEEVNGNIGNGYYNYGKLPTDDMLKRSIGMPVDMVKNLLGFINGDLKNILTVLQQENPQMFEQVMAVVANQLFVRESYNGGYKFNLNQTGIIEVYENLKSMNVNDFIDNYFDEGIYDSIKTFIQNSYDKQVGEVVAEVISLVESYGININDIYALIDRFVAILGNEEFSIEDQITQMSEMPFSDFLSEVIGSPQQVDDFFTMFESMSLMNIFFEGNFDNIDSVVNEILAGISTQSDIEIIADSNEEIVSYKLIFSDMHLQDLNLFDGIFIVEPYGEIEFSQELNDLTSYIDNKKNQISLPEGQTSGQINQNYSLVKENGKWYIQADLTDVCTNNYWDGKELYATGLAKVALDDILEWSFHNDCKDTYYYNLKINLSVSDFTMKHMDENKGGYYEVYPDIQTFFVRLNFYLNIETKEFFGQSLHEYVKNEDKSYANDSCITAGLDYYECTHCGAVDLRIVKDDHFYSKEIEFLPGSKTCEDGITVKSTCLVCGLQQREYTTYWHEPMEEIVDLTPYGCNNKNIIMEKCLCGYTNGLSNNTLWELIGSWENLGTQINADNRTIRYAGCPDDGCDFVIGLSTYTELDEETCISKEYTELYLGANPDDVNDYQDKVVAISTRDSHNYKVVFATVNDEALGCEGGGIIYYECSRCQHSYEEEIHGHQRYEKQIDLGQYGCQCGGNIMIWGCACGREDVVNYIDTHCNIEENEIAGENPDETVRIYTCRDCGFSYKKYIRNEINGCEITENSYYEIAGNIFNCEASTYTKHQTVKEVNLYGESCTDGAYVIERCKVCGEQVNDYETYDHYMTTNEEIIDLSHGDCTCGEKLVITRCACGEEEKTDLNSKCDFDVTSENFTEEGYDNCYRNIYTCAVTSPQCAFKYIIENRRVRIDCVETNIITFKYGVTDENPDGIYSYSEEEQYTYHNFSYITISNEDTTDELGNRVNTHVQEYVCSNCGLNEGTRTTVTTYDSNNVDLSIKINDNDGDILWQERMVKDGIYSRMFTTYTFYASDNREIVYTYDKNNCKVSIEEKLNGDIVNTYEQTYHFYPDSIHSSQMYDRVEPTCTQEGSLTCHCLVCNNEEVEILSPRGHNYIFEEDIYKCSTCGLENFNGADGSIVMEDMSDENNYIVGYYKNSSYEYVLNVTLIPKGNPDGEAVLLDGVNINDDGKSIITVSKAEVEQLAQAKGYDMANYDVRITFVPIDAGGELEYGLTITENGAVAVEK